MLDFQDTTSIYIDAVEIIILWASNPQTE